MSDQQLPSSPRVTLEDLLRIKRAERPPAEFWMEFERSLRSKQLAAIVDKRPWWRLRSKSSSLNRWSIPLGAAAALTLVFTAIRAPHSAPPQAAAVSSNTAPAITAIAQVSAASPAVETSDALEPAISPSSSIAQTVTALPVEPLAIAPTSVAVASTSSAALPDHLVSVTEQIAGIGLAGDVDLEKSAAPKFASVGLKDSSDEMNAVFESSVARLSSGMRPERVASVEPLSQVTSPRDARRARLLAFISSVDTHSPQYSDSSNVIRSRDRIASHLSEEALYDTIRRLGLKNGGVSIQF